MYSSHTLKLFCLGKFPNQPMMRVDPTVMPIGIIPAAGVLEYLFYVLFFFKFSSRIMAYLVPNLPHISF